MFFVLLLLLLPLERVVPSKVFPLAGGIAALISYYVAEWAIRKVQSLTSKRQRPR